MMATMMTEHGRKRALLWYRLGIPLEVRWLRSNWKEDLWGPFKHDWYPVMTGSYLVLDAPYPVAVRTAREPQT